MSRKVFRRPPGRSSFILTCWMHITMIRCQITEPAESPVSTPELALKYPLILNAGRRVAVYTHSRHRSLSSLRAKEPDPVAEIHPQTAAKFGIVDEDQIAIESPRGSIELEARVTEMIRPDTVSVLHGWREANVNLLADHEDCDPMVASPPLRAALCHIRKATRPGRNGSRS